MRKNNSQFKKYLLTRFVSGFSGQIDIGEKNYTEIKTARKNLFEILFIEEKFDFISENFYEYETELLSIASRMMIFHDENYFSMSNERNIIGRRIVNLLSACNMYIDSLGHHLKNIYGEDEKNGVIVFEKSNQYDTRLGYRVMQELRNHVQHRGFPIHTIITSYESVQIEDQLKLSFSVIPALKVDSLKDDGKFKKSILDELEKFNMKNGVDIRPLIRDYIEGIWEIHKKTRELIFNDFIFWESIIDNAFIKFQEEFGAEFKNSILTIAVFDKNGKWTDRNILFKDFINRIKNYHKKNTNFTNLAKCYASNMIRKVA